MKMRIFGIKPSKKFYLGCLIIVLVGMCFSIHTNVFYSMLLSFTGLILFINMELINIYIKRRRK